VDVPAGDLNLWTELTGAGAPRGAYYLNNAQAHLDFASSDTEAEGRALLLLLAFP
jgi:hypothetical protein